MNTGEVALDAGIAVEGIRRRRRLGLLLLALGVVLVAAQSFFEWQIPYDIMALERVRSALGLSQLLPQWLSVSWAVVCAVGLTALLFNNRIGARLPTLAFATGIALGSARLAAGGAVPALIVLLLAGVASLGWQSWREGGLALLSGTVIGIVGWDAALTRFSTLWPFCLALMGMFVWIERQHIQATDRRLIATLTEREALIHDLNSKSEQLNVLQRARTQLLASISHDLRQPLQAVRLYAEAVLGRRPTTEIAGIVERQLRAADDAVGMLDQFSEFSAIEQGALRSQPALVEVRSLLDRLAEALPATPARGQADIRVHGRAAWIWIDRSQLARIVQNLAGNAVRYSSPRSHDRPARVLIAVRPLGRGLAIDIVDNGAGIPADKLQLVFEPYVQLNQVPGIKAGHGLGLAIVRGLVQQTGLALAPVVSRLDRGTRFRVVIPESLRREPPLEGPATRVEEEHPLGWLDGRMLAVLDDEEAPRDALSAALRAAGALVVDAADLATLRERLDAEVRFPDALVFDLDLRSDLDGIDAVRQLRQEWEVEIPAVIVTGRVGAEHLALPERCRLLAKPVRLEQLIDALEPLCDAAEALDS